MCDFLFVLRAPKIRNNYGFVKFAPPSAALCKFAPLSAALNV